MLVIQQAAKMSLSDWLVVLGAITIEAKIKRRTMTEKETESN